MKAKLPTSSVKNDLKLDGGNWGPGMEISSISKVAEDTEWRNTLNPETRVSKWCVYIHNVIPNVASERDCDSHQLLKLFQFVVSSSLSVNQVKSVSERIGTRVLVYCHSGRLRQLLNYFNTAILCPVSQRIFFFNISCISIFLPLLILLIKSYENCQFTW